RRARAVCREVRPFDRRTGVGALMPRHFLGGLGVSLAEVLLINPSRLVHDEGHDTTRPILCRICQKAKSTSALQHAVVVAMIGSALARGIVAFCVGSREKGPGRTGIFAFRHLPIESVLFPRFADDPECVSSSGLTIVRGGSVFPLGCNYAMTDLDGRKLVAPDAPI